MKVIVEDKHIYWDDDEQKWYFDNTEDYEKSQSLSDHDNQVKKEVVQDIKKWCDKNFNWVGDGVGYDGQDYNEMIGSNKTINKLRKFLDQIQDKGE